VLHSLNREEIIVPSQSFTLEANGPQRLNISWRAQFKKVFVSLDGNTIGIIHDKKELSAGQEFRLPDGSSIRIQLVRILTELELQVLRNGQPLPGSASHPQTRLKRASQIIYWAAGACFFISLLLVLFSSEPISFIDKVFPFILFGFVLIPLGFLVQRKALFALILAIFVWLGVGIVGLVLEGYHSVVGVLIYIYSFVYFLAPMILGFGAIQSLKTESE
jgi:hypothetical protein